jgi:hypothetical protein
MASLEYVGWIEEILEVNFGRFQTVLLLCNWVVANYGGSNATMKQDQYGFTSMNFECLIPLSAQSFAFSMHIQQMFFFFFLQTIPMVLGARKLCCIGNQEGKDHISLKREILN